MKKRKGKSKGVLAKHLGKSVGSSRKRNLKRINNKAERASIKKEISKTAS